MPRPGDEQLPGPEEVLYLGSSPFRGWRAQRKPSFVWPLLGAAGFYALSMMALLKNYDWLPNPGTRVFTLTVSASDMGYLLEPCASGRMIGKTCLAKGKSLRVLQETDDAICIQTPAGNRECYRRDEMLRIGVLSTGDFYDDSRVLSNGARIFWSVIYPIVLIIIAGIVHINRLPT
jgi:hypothetical protein